MWQSYNFLSDYDDLLCKVSRVGLLGADLSKPLQGWRGCLRTVVGLFIFFDTLEPCYKLLSQVYWLGRLCLFCSGFHRIKVKGLGTNNHNIHISHRFVCLIFKAVNSACEDIALHHFRLSSSGQITGHQSTKDEAPVLVAAPHRFGRQSKSDNKQLRPAVLSLTPSWSSLLDSPTW